MQAAKTESAEALTKETLVMCMLEHVTRHTSHVTRQVRSKLELLCKELQKRNLEMKIQVREG